MQDLEIIFNSWNAFGEARGWSALSVQLDHTCFGASGRSSELAYKSRTEDAVYVLLALYSCSASQGRQWRKVTMLRRGCESNRPAFPCLHFGQRWLRWVGAHYLAVCLLGRLLYFCCIFLFCVLPWSRRCLLEKFSYRYLQHLQAIGSAPTARESFIEADNCSVTMLGLQVDVTSRKCRMCCKCPRDGPG